jgi:NhaP-type Na+/H+ or K+/H+ antiporter
MNYLKIAGLFLIAGLTNAVAPVLLQHVSLLDGAEVSIALTMWCLSLFLIFGWACSKTAEGTIFPNFTLQLLIGIVLHDALAPLSVQFVLAVVVCTALAAIILKSGGDEIHRAQFIKIAFPTAMIAVVGYFITFFVMFVLLMLLGLDSKTSALLAAIIGSTDPAALIPTLKTLVFKKEFLRLYDISVAESAVNDAVGAIFTAAIAGLILAGHAFDDVTMLAVELARADNLMHLLAQFFFGLLAGVLGWLVMFAYEKYQSKHYQSGQQSAPYDFAMILAVPLLTFFLAQAMHGNGFLAAFVVGLLANFNHGAEHFHTLLHNMETQIESLAKPIIFMMVGPFVDLSTLLDTALLGFAVSCMFIVIARPLAVFISLLPTTISTQEKLFLCAVRETGVIPVVLAVITVAQFPDMALLMPLTAWVVIWTLTLLPALTAWWAKRLNLVQE